MASLGFTFFVRKGDTVDGQCKAFVESCRQSGWQGVIACKASKYEPLLQRVASLTVSHDASVRVLPIDSAADFAFFLSQIQAWHLDDVRELNYLVEHHLLTLPVKMRTLQLMGPW